MAEPRRLLILGGTAEAVALAAQAAVLPGLDIVTALAGRTRRPVQPAGGLRRGGFGGAAGLADYLRAERIDLVIDATHPFAARISANAVTAAGTVGVPRLCLQRPEWTARPGDRWIAASDSDDAAARLPKLDTRAFLAIGHSGLAAFASVVGVWFLVRLIDPPEAPLPLPNAEIVQARGPFCVDDERALLAAHRIDVLVSKNSGGDATYAKIAAARDLGLPVVMIRRPAPPKGAHVETVDAALAWLHERVS